MDNKEKLYNKLFLIISSLNLSTELVRANVATNETGNAEIADEKDEAN